MLFEKNKTFKDNVHGYIEVPLEFVNHFIDSEIFQRLRYIEQTSMRVLYPSARHDRFIHSLGTFHLGNKAFSKFRCNVQNDYSNKSEESQNHFKIYPDYKINNKFWDKCETLFLIACLLHDCGHSPFSHTLEYLYELNSEIRKKLNQLICGKTFHEDFRGHGKPHEVMSAIMVCTEFRSAIEEIIIEKEPIFRFRII